MKTNIFQPDLKPCPDCPQDRPAGFCSCHPQAPVTETKVLLRLLCNEGFDWLSPNGDGVNIDLSGVCAPPKS